MATSSVPRSLPHGHLHRIQDTLATLWIERYEAEGIAGIEEDRPRSGRPRKMTRELEEKIIEKTLTERPPPEVATHWSTRLMAAATGLTREDIGRTWRK